MTLCRTVHAASIGAASIGAAAIGVLSALAALALTACAAQAQAVSLPAVSLPWAASGWVKSHASTARLVAGARSEAAARTVVAGVEVRLNDGWKTYWRHPGDSGGVPPTFDWSGSANLRSARVLFPVPARLVDANGTSIGYKKSVVFPVEITPADPALPVQLVLQFEYGICREICVPAEAKFDVSVASDVASLPPEVTTALARVPRPEASRLASDPGLKAARAVLTGSAPGLAFDIVTGSAGADAELFVEASDGGYLPMPQKVGAASAGVQRFRIDLKGVDELPTLKGKTLQLTIAGANGGAEASWVVK